jgi:hypothetical protein
MEESDRQRINEWKRNYYAKNREHILKYKQEYRSRNRGQHRPRPDKCEICSSEEKLVFDHCHVTNRFRGWLCEPCNRALGMFKDDPKRFRLAAEYLEREGVLDSAPATW